MDGVQIIPGTLVSPGGAPKGSDQYGLTSSCLISVATTASGHPTVTSHRMLESTGRCGRTTPAPRSFAGGGVKRVSCFGDLFYGIPKKRVKVGAGVSGRGAPGQSLECAR